jgi:hypothetical protein
VLTENYKTSGIGDTLVSVRHALLASPSFSLVASAGLEMPTGEYRLIAPTALFDIGVLDPMLQPGSGSWDVLLSAQGSRRISKDGLDLTGALSYQMNTTNPARVQLRRRRDRERHPGGPIGCPGSTPPQGSSGCAGAAASTGMRRSPPTGGTIVYAIPGLVTSLPRAGYPRTLFLPVPVYRYVNETQVAPRLSWSPVSLRTF